MRVSIVVSALLSTLLIAKPLPVRATSPISPQLASARLKLADGQEAAYRQELLALCKAGNTEAQIAYGRFLTLKGEHAEAEHWLKTAAAGNSAEAQYLLGFLYLQVVPQRTQEAKIWMEKASKQGYSVATSVLQRWNRKASIGPQAQLSVLEIVEAGAAFSRVKMQSLPARDILCTGHAPEGFAEAAEASFQVCSKEVHTAFGDWISEARSKEVGMAWGHCFNREILKPSGMDYSEFLKCRVTGLLRGRPVDERTTPAPLASGDTAADSR